MLRKRCLKTVIFVLESPWKVLDFAQQKSVWSLFISNKQGVILNKIHLIVGAKPKTKKPQKQKEAAIPLDTSDQNKSYCVNMGSLTFKIYQGDITAVQVEAIVNGTNTDLDLSLGKNCFYIQPFLIR